MCSGSSTQYCILYVSICIKSLTVSGLWKLAILSRDRFCQLSNIAFKKKIWVGLLPDGCFWAARSPVLWLFKHIEFYCQWCYRKEIQCLVHVTACNRFCILWAIMSVQCPCFIYLPYKSWTHRTHPVTSTYREHKSARLKHFCECITQKPLD